MVTHKTDTMNLSISIGATFVKDTYDEDFSALLSLADKTLYSAKEQG
ncbi:diguanylate cyclase domain-containing protein [Alteromonas macleodii]|nr:diguanylate cyclase [Alteromonas macleodii]